MSEYNICQLNIEGMDCADCAAKVEKHISKLFGVKQAKVDFINAKLNVEFQDSEISLDTIKKEIKDIGYSVKETNQVQKTTLVVEGMDCPDESRPIEDRLKKMDGIQDIQFNLIANKLIIEHTCPTIEIENALMELGFKSELAEMVQKKSEQKFWQQYKMLILTVISGVFAIVGGLLRYLQFADAFTIPILLIAVIAGGFHIFKKGWKEAIHLTLGMNFLMSIAVVGHDYR